MLVRRICFHSPTRSERKNGTNICRPDVYIYEDIERERERQRDIDILLLMSYLVLHDNVRHKVSHDMSEI
jgi:hypothetical protein